MSRPRFNPDRAVGPGPLFSESPEPAASSSAPRTKRTREGRPLTVGEVAALIKLTLEGQIPSPLRVIGEVSNFSHKNHWYFSLKDEVAVLRCVAWATTARKLRYQPKNGDQVIATGHISHYEPQGRTQLYVSDMVPVGAGALEMQFRALCEELRKLGYFDEARKKPLPLFPRRVVVITSSAGAAIHDVINTAAQRCKAVKLLLVDVRVQGEGAAEEIAHAIRWVDGNSDRLGVDAILVTRGGGSIEDLWAFNERIVADAAFACRLPMVAAIGHESDTTIIELVADVRASTPTQAVMRLIPSSQELETQVEHFTHRLGFLLNRLLERQRERVGRAWNDLRRIVQARMRDERVRLQEMWAALAKLQPEAVLAHRQTHLANMMERMVMAIRRRLEDRPRVLRLERALGRAAERHLARLRHSLTALERELAAVDPSSVLNRGYSITSQRDGRLIRSVLHVKRGDAVVTRLSDGSFDSVVGSLNPHESESRARRTRLGRQQDQMDLFGFPQ